MFEAPTNEMIREEAIRNVPLELFNKPGSKSEGLRLVMEEFLRLQFKYFPAFCEETRQINIKQIKELNDFGNKSPTRMIAGQVHEGTSGWSKDGTFKHKWVVPQQLKSFMEHIKKDFWSDENAKIRDKFMKDLLRGGKFLKGGAGGDYYALLDEVYKHYGKNIITAVTKEDLQAVGFSQ